MILSSDLPNQPLAIKIKLNNRSMRRETHFHAAFEGDI